MLTLKGIVFNVFYRVKNHKPKKQPKSKDCEESSCEEGEVDSKETSKKEVLKSIVSVRPRKRKVTSQKDAISQLSATFENLQKAHEKIMQIWCEADQKREETFLQYQEKQAELNRQHELRMMEMMTRFQQPMQPYQNAWVMHEPTFPSAFSGAESQQPHYTNLDSYNR